MKKEEIGKLTIKLIQAEMDGKIIQRAERYRKIWTDTLIMSSWGLYPYSIDFTKYGYRIKPEKTLVPFTWEDRDFLTGKWVMSKEDRTEISMILAIDKSGVSLNYNSFEYDEFLSEFTFLDGSPCGKEVKE